MKTGKSRGAERFSASYLVFLKGQSCLHLTATQLQSDWVGKDLAKKK